MSLSFISIIRLPVLGVLTAFSVIVLSIGAHILNVTVSTINFYWGFVALAVAIPALTFLTIVPSIIISLVMGMAPIFILVESGWLAVLWVLWLATAAYTANSTILLPTVCDFSFVVDGKSVSCHELQALQAFSWLNWLILTAYVPTVFVLSIMAQIRNKSKPGQPGQFVTDPNQQQQQQIYPPQQQQPIYAPQPVYQQPATQQMQQMYPQQVPQQMSPQQIPPQQMSLQQMSPQQMPQQMQAPYAPAATPPNAQNQAPANPGYSPV